MNEQKAANRQRAYTVRELQRVKERLIEIAKRPSGLGEDVDLMIAINVIAKQIAEISEIQ